MDKVSKLIIVGEGGREIVSYDDMSCELNGSVLMVYLSAESKVLPLELQPLLDGGVKNE